MKTKTAENARDAEETIEPASLASYALGGFNFLQAGQSAGAHGAEDLLRRRQMPGLLLGEHQLPVSKHVEHAAAPQSQLNVLHSRLLFQFAFQAPGPLANIGSKETALDLNSHGSPSHCVRC